MDTGGEQKSTHEVRKPARWEKAFLASLRQTGNVSRSARAAKIDRMLPYRHRNAHPDFAEAWDDAIEESADLLEAEARRRAVDGLVRFKFDRKGDPLRHPLVCACGHGRHEGPCREGGCQCQQFTGQPYYELEYSDALLSLLLRGNRPEKYRERDTELSREDLNRLISQELAKLVKAQQASAVGRAAQDGGGGGT